MIYLLFVPYALDPPGLELQMAVICGVGGWKLNLGPIKEQLVLFTSELSLQPLGHHAIAGLDLLVDRMSVHLFIHIF